MSILTPFHYIKSSRNGFDSTDPTRLKLTDELIEVSTKFAEYRAIGGNQNNSFLQYIQSLVPYTQGGTSSLAINAVTFGADNTGSANSTDQIAAAIAEANSLVGTEYQKTQLGAMVVLPAGEYKVDEILMRRNVQLVGEGPGTILVQPSGTNKPVISAESDTEYPFVISDLRIRGTNAPSNEGSNAYGILLNTQTEAGGFTVPDAQHVLNRVWIERTHNDNIRINNGCRGNLLTDLWLKGSIIGSGIRYDGSDSTTSNVVSRGHAVHGFHITGANTRVSNSKAFFCRGNGFEINSSRADLNQCEAQDNFDYGFLILREDATYTGCFADTNQNAGFFINPEGGTIGGICMVGLRSSGRPAVQASKPFVGQNVGLQFGLGTVKDSYFSGVCRNNDDNQFLGQGNENNVNRSGLVLGS